MEKFITNIFMYEKYSRVSFIDWNKNRKKRKTLLLLAGYKPISYVHKYLLCLCVWVCANENEERNPLLPIVFIV